jgi:hypothetical protein
MTGVLFKGCMFSLIAHQRPLTSGSMLSPGRDSLDQVGNAYRFTAVFCLKVGNASYFLPKK